VTSKKRSTTKRKEKNQRVQTPDQGELPPRDRSNVEDTPDNAKRGVRNDRTIDDPRVDQEPRRAPGAENAEDELDDEDYQGEEEVH
jgi:hypothetical protein